MRINDVLVDLAGETLRSSDGRPIDLRPQSFATLRYLIENPNRLVTKGELLAAVWRDVAVTDDSLVQCIHELRRALGDDRHVVLQTAARRGYRLILPGASALSPPPGPSIAVLPFGDLDRPGQPDYFSDGLAEDLITSLSRVAGLFVIARNSSFTFRDDTIDPRRAAADLGVRYLLQGSVRRAGGRLRINARVVDGDTAEQVWAGRFDGA
jgi:TolB-like protein